MNGFINVYKEGGMSSFATIARLRHIYNEKKVGHAGTLDPMATGVLPAGLGFASKFFEFLPEHEKAYRAKFILGMTTDTLDITGAATSDIRDKIKIYSADELEAVLPAFRGDIMQLPPMYSALSKDGVKLYNLARKGIEVEREKRAVTISELTLSEAGKNEFEIYVRCSKGTYIRSLIDDIGKALGCGAVMTELCRTLSNGFMIENAHTTDELGELFALGRQNEAVIPVDEALSAYPGVNVSPAQSVRFFNGAALDTGRIRNLPSGNILRVYSNDGDFLGIGGITDGELKPLKILPKA